MDFYEIREDWDSSKNLFIELQSDVLSFFKSPTGRKWATLVRKKSKQIERRGKKLTKTS